MGSQLSTLTPSEIQRFERDGYVEVRQAFPRTDALVMERRWWAELGDTHGIRRDDRSSWRQIMVFCHPVMVHCAAPNRGARPRFMRIKQQFLTHEGRELVRRLNRPPS